MGDLKIYKYDLVVTDEQIIDMPYGAEILCVQTQRNKPRLWAIVDPKGPKKPWIIHTRGTGHEMGSAIGKKYIGTYQIDEMLVFHVFVTP